MRMKLAYGRVGLWVDLPDDGRCTVIEPLFVPGLEDEAASIRAALRAPLASAPLTEIIQAAVAQKGPPRVKIVFSDITRPMPNDRVLPVLLDVGDVQDALFRARVDAERLVVVEPYLTAVRRAEDDTVAAIHLRGLAPPQAMAAPQP